MISFFKLILPKGNISEIIEYSNKSHELETKIIKSLLYRESYYYANTLSIATFNVLIVFTSGYNTFFKFSNLYLLRTC